MIKKGKIFFSTNSPRAKAAAAAASVADRVDFHWDLKLDGAGVVIHPTVTLTRYLSSPTLSLSCVPHIPRYFFLMRARGPIHMSARTALLQRGVCVTMSILLFLSLRSFFFFFLSPSSYFFLKEPPCLVI